MNRWSDEHGASSTEYLFLLVLVALVIVGGATFFGTALDGRFSTAGASVQNSN